MTGAVAEIVKDAVMDYVKVLSHLLAKLWKCLQKKRFLIVVKSENELSIFQLV
jgi:hypothetical protein